MAFRVVRAPAHKVGILTVTKGPHAQSLETSDPGFCMD